MVGLAQRPLGTTPAVGEAAVWRRSGLRCAGECWSWRRIPSGAVVRRQPDTLGPAERDPRQHPVAILLDEAPVGFLVLHGGVGAGRFVRRHGEFLIRAFFVDAAASTAASAPARWRCCRTSPARSTRR